MTTTKKKTVSLVLGSGGARGLAHISVIHWLEENNFTIQSIAGSSIGALVGGIHAAGRLDDFEQWVRTISRLDIVSLLDFSWEKSGLIKGNKLIANLVDLVGDKMIEDLPITFTAVAVDIANEKELWIRSGRLFDAIRSSISTPLFFTPFHYKGVDLIDGGVLNPVPIAPTFSDNTELTVAVNLEGPVTANEDIREQHPITSYNLLPFKEKINQFLEKFLGEPAEQKKHDWDVYDVAHRAFEAMQSTIARQKLAAYPPDHTIEIPRNACMFLEFDRAAEMIDLGYKKAQEHLARIHEKNRNNNT
jgi:NTE family protein